MSRNAVIGSLVPASADRSGQVNRTPVMPNHSSSGLRPTLSEMMP